MSIEIKKQYELVDYKQSVEFMKARVGQVINETNKEMLWFLSHDHIYTQGTSEDSIIEINCRISFFLLLRLIIK